MEEIKIKHLDLFSGIGGFALSAKWAGFETIKFVEKDKFCQKVLAKNFPDIPIHEDIKDFNYSNQVDLLTGGFPCQGFSIAGKQRGIYDKRYLWPEMFRIIKQCNPSWIIAENVTGIIKMEFNNIISDLEKENYKCSSYIIPACGANAPHRRDRLWIVAHSFNQRCNMWADNREERRISKDWNRNMETIQSKWEKLKPESWKTYCARDWIEFNTPFIRKNDGVPTGLDKLRIKALGNAIVPQVVYPIMKFIYEVEKSLR